MTWATCVPNVVLLGLSVLDLCPMYVTDRRQTASSLIMPPPYRDGDIISGDVTAAVTDVTMVMTRSCCLQCVNAAGKCFSSGQCCRGLVCAAIDDYFGNRFISSVLFDL